MLIFYQRKADKSLTAFPKTNPRRNCNSSLPQEKFWKFKGLHFFKCLGNLCPYKHCCLWRFNIPASVFEPLNKNIPAVLICLSYLLNTVLGSPQCNNACNLNWLKHAIIQIAFNACKRSYNFPVAHTKSNSPACHRITFCKRKKFNADVFSAWRL